MALLRIDIIASALRLTIFQTHKKFGSSWTGLVYLYHRKPSAHLGRKNFQKLVGIMENKFQIRVHCSGYLNLLAEQ